MIAERPDFMMPKLTQHELEAHLWGAANILRGNTAGQDFKTCLLTLLLFKHLSDQWDAEVEGNVNCRREQHGVDCNDTQRRTLMTSPDIHRFRIPDGCHWDDVTAVSENIGAMLNAAMRGGSDPRDPENKRGAS